MNSIFGMNVRTSSLVQPVPVLKLSADFKHISDEFRSEIDAWLLDMFGAKEVAYMIGGNTLVLNSEMLNKLKQAIPNRYLFPNNIGAML